MAAGVGIEPTNDGIKIRCLTAWRTRNKKKEAQPHVPMYVLELSLGIEPRTEDYKSTVLPLNYESICNLNVAERVGFEPTHQLTSVYALSRGTSLTT